jgi:hypothetical protein
MSTLTERRFTYANVMSTIAVFFALSGTAVAGTLITSGDVKNNSLRSVDLKDNAAVASSDVVDGALTGADLNESSLGKVPTAGIADSATTAGTATNAGSAGQAPVSGYQRVYGGDQTLAANGNTTFDADCPAGKVAISGGYWTSAGDVEVMWGYVVDDNTFRVAFWNTNVSNSRSVGVHVVCVHAVP